MWNNSLKDQNTSFFSFISPSSNNSEFHTDADLFLQAENYAIEAKNNNDKQVENDITQLKTVVSSDFKQYGKIMTITDDIIDITGNLGAVLETISSIRYELAKTDTDFLFNLVKDTPLSERTDGDVRIVEYNGYIVEYKDNKIIIYSKNSHYNNGANEKIGIIYTQTNIYEDLSDPEKKRYKRVDMKTGKLKAISIYDNENMATNQFGASQEAFLMRDPETNELKYDMAGSERYHKLISNPFLWQKLQEDIPESKFGSPYAARDFYFRYFNTLEQTGCGYAATTNAVFSHYEGHEDEFESRFGYPMYTVKDGQIDFNYETMMLDFYNYEFKDYPINVLENGKNIPYVLDNVNPLSKLTAKDTSIRFTHIDNFLNDEYNCNVKLTKSYNLTGNDNNTSASSDINTKFLTNENVIYGGAEYNLINENGQVIYENGGGHAMSVVGIDPKTGYPIVSSWGQKFILEPLGTDSGLTSNYELTNVQFNGY